MKKDSLYREQALEHYLRKNDNNTLLRLPAPPPSLLYWLLILVIVFAGLFAWFIQVPIYTNTQGLLRADANQQMVKGILFLAPNQVASIHVGQETVLTLNNYTLVGHIDQIEKQPISPQEAQRRFLLSGQLETLVSGPSIVVTVQLDPNADNSIYNGSICLGRIQVGSRRALSLLPGLNQIFLN